MSGVDSLIGQMFPGDGITAEEFISACKDRGMIASIEGDKLTVTSKSKYGRVKQNTFTMLPYSDGTYEPGVVVLLDAWKEII